ncbi:MAG: hypothetical protein GEU75_12600 [Dehalococcoidia bacterium]|nr:hypothetical protein [Dehalococcoidia bacterium]
MQSESVVPGQAARERGSAGRIARSIASPAFIVVGALLLFLANLLLWADTTVLDSGEFTRTVGGVLDEPAVEQRLAGVLAARATESGAVQQQVGQRLPENLAFLSPILNSQVEALLAETARRLLAADLTGDLRDRTIAGLHTRLVAILEDDAAPAAQVQGNDLVLDLREVLLRLFDRLGVTPPQRLAEPTSDIGQVVILEDTAALRQASFLVKNVQEILLGLLFGSVAAFSLGVATASRRANSGAICGYAILAVGVITLLIIRVANLGLDSYAGDRVVARSFVNAVVGNLEWQSLGLILLGVCLVAMCDSRIRLGLQTFERRVRARLEGVGSATLLVIAAGMGLVLLLV